MVKNEMKLFSCNSNHILADKIADYLKIKISDAEVGRFKDGEISVKLNESVRGVDVFILQSTCRPTNDHLMELLLMIDAAYRASARKITAIIPYFGYSRQDRKVEPRVPISAKVIANLLQAVGVNRVLTMDLHADQIQGFFDVPVDNLFLTPIVIKHLKNSIDLENTIIVSPDSGGVNRARFLAKQLNIDGLAIVDKRRPKANVSEVMNVIGDVKNKICILIDDIVDTAGSISEAAIALRKNGAKDVYCVASHAILSGNAKDNLKGAGFNQIIFSDTIPIPEEKIIDNFKVLSTAPLFGEAIERIFKGESVSNLFIQI